MAALLGRQEARQQVGEGAVGVACGHVHLGQQQHVLLLEVEVLTV